MADYDILLIEDDAELCSILSNFIVEKGYTIQTAENGLAAQEYLRSDNYRMIISDVNIPNRNGLQLAALARGSRAHANVPIVLMSGQVDSATAIKAKELRIIDLMVKPIELSDLMAKIESYLHTPKALYVNPIFQKSFEKAVKSFFDTFLGNNTIVEQKSESKDWGKESEISSFIMFNNTEVSGELVFNTTSKVMHQMACAVFNCSDTPADEELMINMTIKVVERLANGFVSQLMTNGIRMECSTPKVQLNYTDQDHVESTQSLLCIPFSTGEKACRVDFIINRNKIVGKVRGLKAV